MCGIVGAFAPSNGHGCRPDIVERMRDTMVHRGPDGAGIWSAPDGKCTLGHRRLAIIDLSEAAAQPMANHDASVVIAFNGEIYNHAEIRAELKALGKYSWKTDHSDTETLLHAYEEWGLDCFKRFYGMWGVCIYDRRDPRSPVMHLVRDRVGIKPVYITRTQAGTWLFASEIKALLAHPDVSPQMDLTAFWHYLTFIVAPAPLTMFRGIFKIPAGHSVTIKADGTARAEQYWDCLPDDTEMAAFRDEDEAAEVLHETLKKAIERRMVSDVPFGVLLSGGVDSSLNVALMSQLMDRPVTTFSVGYEEHEHYNEFQFARRVAKQYGTDHHEVLISSREAQDFLPELVTLQDEPIADNVCIPLYFLAKLVKESGTTVVQVGEGADENFLGYWWCEHYRKKAQDIYNPALAGTRMPWYRRLLGKVPKLPGNLGGQDLEFQNRGLAGQHLFWGGAACWTGDLRAQLTPDASRFAQEVDCPVQGLLPPQITARDSHEVIKTYLGPAAADGPFSDVLLTIPYMEHKLRLPEHLLMRVDKMTMAHSIEARVPFLDHDTVDFARRLPPGFKLHDGVGKAVVKKVASRYLDKDIVYRKKQGFGAPMEEWFKEPEFGKRCVSAWEKSAIRKEGLLDGDYVSNLIDTQINSSGGWSFHIWTILNAVIWHERWIENQERASL